MTPVVSILIPAYNAEKWIADTIKSALSQTWPKKEIVIVDDGSTDNTLQIARQFESNLVKVVTQENRGASSARNRALSLAQGDYIQYLDADDLLAPDKISQQLKYADNGKNSRILFSSAWCGFYYRHQKARFIPNPLWRDLTQVEWITTKFNENTFMIIQSWLISRELVELAGPWNESLTLDDDGEYICRVVATSEKIKFVPEAKSYYRQWNIGSLSRSASDKACESLFLSLKLSIEYLLSLEDSERTILASLKYLQTWYHYFYPEKHELLRKIDALAHELGGKLSPPELSWKYLWIKKIVGWEAAKNVRNKVRKTKLLAYMNWDRLLYKLSIQ